MKKKSLYDIAMQRKQNTMNDKIIIVKKKYLLLTILEIIVKIFKFILYLILLIILTIGTTVLLNSQTRELILNVISNTL